MVIMSKNTLFKYEHRLIDFDDEKKRYYISVGADTMQ